MSAIPNDLQQLPADLTALPGNPTPQQAQDMLRHLRESRAVGGINPAQQAWEMRQASAQPAETKTTVKEELGGEVKEAVHHPLRFAASVAPEVPRIASSAVENIERGGEQFFPTHGTVQNFLAGQATNQATLQNELGNIEQYYGEKTPVTSALASQVPVSLLAPEVVAMGQKDPTQMILQEALGRGPSAIGPIARNVPGLKFLTKDIHLPSWLGGEAVPEIPADLQPVTPPVEAKVPENVPPKIAPKPPRGIKIAEPTEGPLSTVLKQPEPTGPDIVQKWQGQQQQIQPGWNPETTEKPSLRSILTPEQRRRAGQATLPVTPEQARNVQTMLNTGPVNEALRKATAGTELDVHNAMTALEPHFKLGRTVLDTPEKQAAFINTIDKTPAGQKAVSPFPELQPFVDAYVKEHQKLIDRDNALGITGAEHTPNHIQFMAQPTERTISSPLGGSGLTGPEGYSYKRESPDWESFVKSTDEAGMIRPYSNPLEMMTAGLAQRAKAVNVREMVENDWKPQGLAQDLPSNGKTPEGWTKAPGLEKTMVPNDVAKGLNYYFQNRNMRGWMGAANDVAMMGRFYGDTVTVERGLASNVGNTIAMLMRGQNPLKYNPITAYMRGYKELFGPQNEELNSWVREAAEGGMRTRAMKQLPLPDLQRTWIQSGKNTLAFIPRLFTKYYQAPLKVGWGSLAAEYGGKQIMDGKWTNADADAFNRRYTKFQDDMLGGSGEVNTSHPGVIQAADIADPLWRYHTGGIRSGARAIGETIAEKGNVKKTTLPEAIGGLTGHIAIGLGAAMAISKITTGHVITPHSLMDLFFPQIGVNPDGTPKRLALAGIFLPLAESIEHLSKGEYESAIPTHLNPAITAFSQAINGHDWKGDTIGDGSLGDKAWYALKNSVNPITWSELQQGNIADAFGFRTAPKSISNSAFMNAATEIRQQEHRSLTDEQQKVENQKYDWMDRLSGEGSFRTNLQPVIAEMIKAKYDKDQIRELIENSLTPRGVPRMAQTLESQQLAQIWDKASKQEKLQMLPILRDRVHNRKDTESPQTKQGWIDLIDKF